MSADGTYSSPMRTYPKTRLAVEASIVASSAACVVIFGIVAKERASQNDYYVGWYWAMMGLLAVLV